MKGNVGIVTYTNNFKEAIPSSAQLKYAINDPHSIIVSDKDESNFITDVCAISFDQERRGFSNKSYAGQIIYGHPSSQSIKESARKWLDTESPFADVKPINVFVDVDEKREKVKTLAKQFNEQVEAGEKKDFMLTAKTKYPEIDQLCDLIDAMTKLANSSSDDEIAFAE